MNYLLHFDCVQKSSSDPKMRDVNCYVKVAPTVHRKDEAEFLNHYDAPFPASNNQTGNA